VPDDYDDVQDERTIALSRPRTQTMDIDDDDDDNEDLEDTEEVEDVEEIFVRACVPLPSRRVTHPNE
jgi:essential nuclear protein 1